MTTVRPNITDAYDRQCAAGPVGRLARMLRAVRRWLIRVTGLTIIRVPLNVGEAFELGRRIEQELNQGYIERLGEDLRRPETLAPVVPLRRDSGVHLAWPARDGRGPA